MQSYSNYAYMHGYYSIFVYMHNFASIDKGVFFVKMSKINNFFVFCTNWCDCSYAAWVQAI